MRNLATGNYMTHMAQDTLMFGANHRLIIMMLIVTVGAGILYGLNAVGRSSEIFIIILALCLKIFFFAVMSSDVFHQENLLPMFASGIPQIAKDASRTTLLPFGELIAFILIFPYVKQKNGKGILKRSYIAIAVSTLLLIVISISIVAILGTNLASNFEYPFYHAMQLAGMSGVLERLDPIAIVIVIVSEYFKLVLYSYITVLAFKSLHKKFNFKFVLATLMTLILIIAPFVHLPETNFSSHLVALSIFPIFEIGLPVLMWIVSEIKYRKKHQQKVEKRELAITES